VEFAEELELVLPADFPRRTHLIGAAGKHLDLIVEANRHFNLTRITHPRDAAIKHVLDSVVPWKRFASAQRIMDAGSGPGFPGIPLAIIFPDKLFTLAESIQKKARFLEAAVKALELPNVKVEDRRAEDILRTQRFDVITARAVAPVVKALSLFAHALGNGATALLYKGPDVESEIAQARSEAATRKIRIEIIERYDLPNSFGSRTIVQLQRALD
jgi:16S rRNA (guanine527-N7)-methyltransferase